MKVSGTFIARELATPVDIGFIPDHIKLYELTSTAEVMYDWYRCLYDKGSTFMYGISHNGDGALADVGSADAGIIPYEEGEDVGIMIEHPTSGKLVKTTAADWTSDNSTNAVAKAASASPVIGTCLRPTTHNGYVYECITAGTSSGTEPTWPTVPGETVLDNNVLFICRKEIVAKGGGQGFQIGVDLSVNTDIWVFEAEKHLRSEDMGDADDGVPVRFAFN